jgi:outer membrane protein OmpA-like peptidoglycan-associated protein
MKHTSCVSAGRVCFLALALAACAVAQAKDFGEAKPTAAEIIEALSKPPKVIGKGALPRARISLQIQFEKESAELEAASKDALLELAKALNDDRLRSRRYEVLGHTDRTGAVDYNLSLSEARAKAVVAFLSTNNVEARRLSPIGRGFADLLPIPDKKAAAHRRVEVVQLLD